MSLIRIIVGDECVDFSDYAECVFYKDGICIWDSLFIDPHPCLKNDCRFCVEDEESEGDD